MHYAIRPVLDEMMEGVKLMLQEDAVGTGGILASMPTRAKAKGGGEPK